VGLGWNEVEYAALGQDFHNRGRRIEEQVEVMRLLWQNPLVQFDGKWHGIPDAGLNPMPPRGSIPIWFGGHADRVLERVARLGDGWMPNQRTAEDARGALEKLDEYLERAGRARLRAGPLGTSGFGLEARISFGAGNPDEWLKLVRGWQSVGASHISFNTMGAGLASAGEHVRAIQRIAAAVGVE
jgi:hypothetical protein